MNHLRNILLGVATTPYVFLVDADFVPSEGIEGKLQQHIKSLLHSSAKRALLVPAFELLDPQVSVPRDKKEMLMELKAKTVAGFK